MQATSIDEVLKVLSRIIAESENRPSKLGYFAALYRQVTAAVKRGIAEDFFDDGPRMEVLDVVFANRYLAAYEAWQAGQQTSKSWREAFRRADDDEEIILQHLLLGLNAHINLDLSIAAAEVAPGAELASLKDDFGRINELLGSLIEPVENLIGEFSPLLGILDSIGGKTDERLIGFSLTIARKEAWEHAELLAQQDGAQRAATIKIIDRKVAFLSKNIAHPGFLLSTGLRLIKHTESDDVPAIISALSAGEAE